MSMQGKVAVVTGSTSGIGYGIATALASRGCSLIITGLADQATIDQVITTLKSDYKVEATFVPGDLRSVTSIENFCKQVLELYPTGVDILINNAGVQHLDLVEDYPTEKWDMMVAVSLSAPFHLMKAFLPGMKTKGWGRIVNMSSQMGMISGPGKAPYSAVKAGLIGLAKGVALEGAAHGITCNCICPGFADAPIFNRTAEKMAKEQNITTEEALRRGFAKNPTGKPVTISEIAELAMFMCSDAGASMTGSAVLMDAGFTSQ
ncbi:D-beta-hydroxybutyrate dehydrogenase-like [Ylistrum balloti]|uniref:D-beta-hydroxybutyrate dehydrogenase-like n=1 Tax=Ylistrum balloti TaxID=509963 RepID=UPI0029058766|nr:D-beta-hydroxybutyrate dehydrogenase-like [Ylistrum balloti]XP_060080374.1 D-beta-hydroxybutyrate dehydrogenase-like [Ylistrum balloti]